jgi:hypothetical protein
MSLALGHRKTCSSGKAGPRVTVVDSMKSTLDALGPRGERPVMLFGGQCEICC